MTDKAKLADQQARGARAEAILNDPLVKDAFATIEADLDTLWKQSPADDREGRERVYFMSRSLGAFRQIFETTMCNGRQATKDLQRLIDAEKDKK